MSFRKYTHSREEVAIAEHSLRDVLIVDLPIEELGVSNLAGALPSAHSRLNVIAQRGIGCGELVVSEEIVCVNDLLVLFLAVWNLIDGLSKVQVGEELLLLIAQFVEPLLSFAFFLFGNPRQFLLLLLLLTLFNDVVLSKAVEHGLLVCFQLLDFGNHSCVSHSFTSSTRQPDFNSETEEFCLLLFDEFEKILPFKSLQLVRLRDYHELEMDKELELLQVGLVYFLVQVEGEVQLRNVAAIVQILFINPLVVFTLREKYLLSNASASFQIQFYEFSEIISPVAHLYVS